MLTPPIVLHIFFEFAFLNGLVFYDTTSESKKTKFIAHIEDHVPTEANSILEVKDDEQKTLFRCFGNVSDSLYRRRIDRCHALSFILSISVRILAH